MLADMHILNRGKISLHRRIYYYFLKMYFVSTVCGGILMGYAGGNFTSPGYDGVKNYTSKLNCEWTIENPSHYNSSIYISFEDFHLEHHQVCQYDYLELQIGLYVQHMMD